MLLLFLIFVFVIVWVRGSKGVSKTLIEHGVDVIYVSVGSICFILQLRSRHPPLGCLQVGCGGLGI